MADFLSQGKQHAQSGNYEEALDSFMLALENDKENADIHFFLGACYSSMEEFRYARYHYEIAIRLNPDHERTKMVWEGVKDVIPERPPERKLLRGAAARTRKKQDDAEQEATAATPETVPYELPQETPNEPAPGEPRIKRTEEKWEQAFPGQTIDVPEHRSIVGGGFFLWLLIVGGIIAGAYFYITMYITP